MFYINYIYSILWFDSDEEQYWPIVISDVSWGHSQSVNGDL